VVNAVPMNMATIRTMSAATRVTTNSKPMMDSTGELSGVVAEAGRDTRVDVGVRCGMSTK
jgi:hypothetical protein